MTLHTTSDNNGLNPPTSPFEEARQAIIDETAGNGAFQGRIAANQAWLNKAFDVAERKRARGLVIMTHTNPHFDQPVVIPGYEEMLRTIRDRSVANIPNNLQVLYVYGDSHIYSIGKPFPLLGEYPPYPPPLMSKDKHLSPILQL